MDQLVGSGHTADSLRALTLNHNDGPSPDLGTDSFNPFTEAVARSGCGEVEDACWITLGIIYESCETCRGSIG